MLTLPANRTTEDAALRALISVRIEAGPLTFRDFMELALYHPAHGYYRSRRLKLGRDGDFLTSPEVHPAFGATIARALLPVWREMGEPLPLTIIEPGAGSGALASDLLGALVAAGVDDVDYRIVESSPALVELQQERLDTWAGGVRWTDWDSLAEPVAAAFVVSNELFDSLPVHRVRNEGGKLREIYVVEDEGELRDAPGPLSTTRLTAYFDELGVYPGEGCTAEVNLEAPRLMTRLARAFEQGVVLSFDYGHEAATLYARWRTDGTLLCYYRHAADADPYQRVGRQDMTTHVDWTSLKRAGEAAGLSTAFLVAQAEFLAASGIAEYLGGTPSGKDVEEYFARRRAIGELLDPGGLGRVRVLA